MTLFSSAALSTTCALRASDMDYSGETMGCEPRMAIDDARRIDRKDSD